MLLSLNHVRRSDRSYHLGSHNAHEHFIIKPFTDDVDWTPIVRFFVFLNLVKIVKLNRFI